MMLFESDDTKSWDAGGVPEQYQPLAARLRPRNLSEVVGQRHLLEPGRLLRRAIEADSFTAIILFGPPGCGKTTIAEVIARQTESYFARLSAVSATVKDVRKVVDEADARLKLRRQRTILFLDEIHRFSRSQQDVLLPEVEQGRLRLIGATTENPYHYIVGPLLSRSQIFQLEPLEQEDILVLLHRALTDRRGFGTQRIVVDKDALDFLAIQSEGDARFALSALELSVRSTTAEKDGTVRVDLATMKEVVQKKVMVYGDDGHYDCASAFIKSMRGSDPDAAIYWMARMLEAGEDPRFIARRLLIFASEDVGNADPRALGVAVDVMQAVEYVGMPEARIILAQGVCYCATAPKSNASYLAVDRALADVRNKRIIPVPKALRDSHYRGAKDLGHGKGYDYPHNHQNGFVVQDYLGVDVHYYEPVERGYERKIRERIAYWNQLRQQNKEAAEGDGGEDHAG